MASITLLTGAATLPSDGALPAEITAFVRNASNQFMADVPVAFSTNSGGLLVTQGTTNASGQAKATLSPAGDPTSRTITVTALAGSVSATVTVNVTGTSLSVQGPNALTLSQQGTYRVTLLGFCQSRYREQHDHLGIGAAEYAECEHCDHGFRRFGDIHADRGQWWQ